LPLIWRRAFAGPQQLLLLLQALLLLLLNCQALSVQEQASRLTATSKKAANELLAT